MYFNAISIHRIGHAAHRRKIPLIPSLCHLLIHILFNSYVAMNAKIGPGTFCAHRGIGVVIGRRAQIGARCIIRAHVVIGSSGSSRPGQPRIGDDVEIGVGAKILGPISIGNGATIGANAVVLDDVKPGDVVVGIPARSVRSYKGRPQPSGAAD